MMTTGGPFVYGRTALVDFRLLAVPEGQGEAGARRLLDRVLIALRSPAELRAGAWRRVLVRSAANDTLIGVAGMARDLLPDPNQQDKTADRDPVSGQPRRPLYLFAGYLLGPENPPPAYDALQLEDFTPLYDYVLKAWEERPGEHRPPLECGLPASLPWAEPATPPERAPTGGAPAEGVELAAQAAEVVLWRDDEPTRRALWEAARTGRGPAALYLGLAAAEDAQVPEWVAAAAPDLPVTATVVGLSTRTATLPWRRTSPPAPPVYPEDPTRVFHEKPLTDDAQGYHSEIAGNDFPRGQRGDSPQITRIAGKLGRSVKDGVRQLPEKLMRSLLPANAAGTHSSSTRSATTPQGLSGERAAISCPDGAPKEHDHSLPERQPEHSGETFSDRSSGLSGCSGPDKGARHLPRDPQDTSFASPDTTGARCEPNPERSAAAARRTRNDLSPAEEVTKNTADQASSARPAPQRDQDDPPRPPKPPRPFF